MSTVENDLAAYECEASRIERQGGFEEWFDPESFTVEDVEYALAWHAETYQNDYLGTCLALWHGVSQHKTDKLEARAKALRKAVDEIVEAYAKEVLWPRYLKKRG